MIITTRLFTVGTQQSLKPVYIRLTHNSLCVKKGQPIAKSIGIGSVCDRLNRGDPSSGSKGGLVNPAAERGGEGEVES